MRKRRRTGSSNLSGYGFDYGIGITATAIGSIEFNKNLVDAEIVAVAYGDDYSQELGLRVPAIILVGRNEEPLRKAFEEFSNWAERTDADAIEVTIVFREDGGYRFCINPEVGALYKRVLQYDTVVNRLALQLMWIKVIATTSQQLIELRELFSAGIVRPFLLRAAHYTGILQKDQPPIPELLKPIADREELLKFEINFVDEGSKDDSHWQRVGLGGEKEKRKRDRRMPKSMVWTRRNEALKRLFPVTLWSSQSFEPCIELRRSAKEFGLQEWQIDQAICNLVLSREMASGKFHFQGCSKRDWPDQLWKTLCSRFEISGADQQGFAQLTVEDIVDQAILDARVLLRKYGVKRVSKKIKELLYMLEKHSLLSEPKQ